jgi:DNA-binding transcriptional LysR family regulator
LEEEVLLAVPPGHRFADLGAVPLADALREPSLLLSMPGHGLRAMVDEQADAFGISLVPGVELRSQQALLAMVAAGGGVTFAPAMTLVGARGVVAVPTNPPQRRQVGWIRRKGRHIPPIGVRLLKMLGGARGSL